MSDAAKRTHDFSWRSRNDDQVIVEVKHLAEHARAGGVSVRAADVQLRDDLDDEPVLLLVLTLSSPASGLQTWPVDELYELRRALREQAVQASIPFALAFTFRQDEEPETASEPDASGDDAHLTKALREQTDHDE